MQFEWTKAGKSLESFGKSCDNVSKNPDEYEQALLLRSKEYDMARSILFMMIGRKKKSEKIK